MERSLLKRIVVVSKGDAEDIVKTVKELIPSIPDGPIFESFNGGLEEYVTPPASGNEKAIAT
jgi:hypothetical protein